MLGIGRQKLNFELSAHGKHPAFSDYFSLNTDFPLVNALLGWVEKGVKFKTDTKENRMSHSFRFWVRGIKKGELVLGIIRDSSDRLGRPYPLLIMGSGFVKDWEKRWQYIFNSFETVFRAFEDSVASRYESFKEFETKLARINFPESLSVKESNVGMEQPGLFSRKADVPGAVFQGGLPENPVLTIYTRPLKTNDFLDLFNISHGEQNSMGGQNQ